MDFKTFLENFDVIAEAPGGIPKLRSLILDLAVRGKLVAQNPEDEAASVLFDKSKFQREQWIEAGKIRKSKQLPAISQEEVPYQQPQGWEWCRFSSVVFFQEGPGIRNWQFRTTGIKLLNVKNIVQGELVLENSDKYISEEEFNQKYRHFLIEEGDLLFASSGNSWGKTAFFKDPGYRVMVNTSTIRMRFFVEQCSNQYLRYFLDSDLFKHQMQIQLQGIQPNFGSLHLTKVVIPLPPLAEQKRIVEKVDELMALCDRYEAAKQTRDNLRQKLRGSAITSLMNAETDEELDAAWVFVRDNWQSLSQHPEDVNNLRQSILVLAVRGKLVPQNSSEEAVSVLLKQIKLVKQELAEQGKIKKTKPLDSISVDEVPYQIPETWEWVWIDNISDIGTGSTPLTSNTEYYEGGSIPWITSTATSQEFIYKAESYITELAVKDYRLRTYQPGCLIIALYGQGKTRGQISRLKIPATINQACAAITLIHESEEHREYIRYVFKEKYEELRALAAGGAQPNLNVGKIKATLIPLPPLAEQKRILAKVDELMRLCDQLETSLRLSQQRAESLAASAISHLII